VNPYRWDLVDPFLFYGRGGTVAHLVDRLLAGDRFAVAGGRRMGKTTLLRRLELELARIEATGGLIVMPVFVDLAELYGGSAEEAYRLLARRTRAAAQAAHLPTDDSDVTSGPELAESLQALLEATRRLGRLQLVFLFDEIERVPLNTWGGGFLAYWRMLLNNRGELSRCLSAVFSGAGGIYRIAQDAGSPLGNILAWHELELFSYEETARLVREPSGNIWPDPLVDRIYEASGGHPCLIQYLMQRVCDGELSLRSGQAPSASSGAVPSVAREQAGGTGLTVDFGDGRVVVYGAADLLDLDHAYGLTVHRAQGSEWPGVVVLASSSFGPILSRNLLYTALTRARRAVVVVGDQAAIAEAVARTRDQERVTGLPVLLEAGVREAPPPDPLPTAAERGSPTASCELAPSTCGPLPSPSQWGGVGGGASFAPSESPWGDDREEQEDAPRAQFVDEGTIYDPMPDDWPD
jgi:hypothetical protein